MIDRLVPFLSHSPLFSAAGEDGADSVLARATVVDYEGRVVLDLKAKPEAFITDFRSRFHGLTGKDLFDALPFKEVQRQVEEAIKDKIVVGHDLKHDFQALLLTHPKGLLRDTAYYKPLRSEGAKKRRPSLKTLSRQRLGMKIQSGAHDSGEDARAALMLYKSVEEAWELELKSKKQERKKQKTV